MFDFEKYGEMDGWKTTRNFFVSEQEAYEDFNRKLNIPGHHIQSTQVRKNSRLRKGFNFYVERCVMTDSAYKEFSDAVRRPWSL